MVFFFFFFFFTSDVYKNYNVWSCQKVCDALVYFLFIFWITFLLGLKLNFCRQSIGIPMETDCTPLVADFFFFYKKYFMKSHSRENQFKLP